MIEKDIQEFQRKNLFHSLETNINGKPRDKLQKSQPTIGGGRVSPQGFTSGFEVLPENFQYSYTPAQF